MINEGCIHWVIRSGPRSSDLLIQLGIFCFILKTEGFKIGMIRSAFFPPLPFLERGTQDVKLLRLASD